jgi:6-phosphogluconolactonase
MFTDERYVPADDAASNYHQVRDLIKGLDLPPGRVLRVETERPLEEAAARYDRALDRFLEQGGLLRLGILGLGADGHTASLFKRDDLRAAEGRWAMAVQRPDGRAAVTVTPRLLARVARLVFLAAGPAKRAAVRGLMQDPAQVVAGRAVAGHRRVEIWTDPEAWPR